MPIAIEKCIICGAFDNERDEQATTTLSLLPPFCVKRCNSCGFRWLAPQPTREEYELIYSGSYFGEADTRSNFPSWLNAYSPPPFNYQRDVLSKRIKIFRKRLTKLAKLMAHIRDRKPSILDVGAGTGDLLYMAQQMGFAVTGVEVSTWACQMAKEKYSLDIYNMNIEDFIPIAVEKGLKFDAVHMNHVFEHLLKPREILLSLRSLMRQNAVLIIEIPNQFNSLREFIYRVIKFRDLCRSAPSLLSLHHPFFYNPSHIKRIVSESGFKVQYCKTGLTETNCGGIKLLGLKAINVIGNIIANGKGDNIVLYATCNK